MVPARLAYLAFACLFTAGTPAVTCAASGDIVAGPIETKVIRVLDGDTFLAEAMIWPGQIIRVSVRIRGIDAPEKRSKCTAERKAAVQASAALAALLEQTPVTISNVGGGKYYGRVLADVNAGEIRSVAAVMLSHSLVRPYHGGKRQPHCLQ